MKKTDGFTLIELLISISIIAILSVVLSVSFSSAQKNGRDQRRISDMKAIQNAAEQYYLLNNSQYPTSTGVAWTGSGAQMILQKFPVDPKKSAAGATVPYSTNLTTSTYCICADMENESKNSNSEAGCNFINWGYFCIKNQQ